MKLSRSGAAFLFSLLLLLLFIGSGSAFGFGLNPLAGHGFGLGLGSVVAGGHFIGGHPGFFHGGIRGGPGFYGAGISAGVLQGGILGPSLFRPIGVIGVPIGIGVGPWYGGYYGKKGYKVTNQGKYAKGTAMTGLLGQSRFDFDDGRYYTQGFDEDEE